MSEPKDKRKFWVAICESHIRGRHIDDCISIDEARKDAIDFVIQDGEPYYVLEAIERIAPTAIVTPLKAVKPAKKGKG